MSKTVRITPDYIRKVIAEEKAIVSEHRRYKRLLFIEGQRLEAEGYDREQINEGLMDIVFSLGSGFIESFKEDLANALMSAIGIDVNGYLAKAIANTVGNIDILEYKKYFGPGGCTELTNLIMESLGETVVEPIADSVIATLGINPQSRLYAGTREALVHELMKGALNKGISEQINEFICSIDVSDIFGSFKRTVTGITGIGGDSTSAAPAGMLPSLAAGE